jgi:hypothetical protein
MPERRLQRTRDAYKETIPWCIRNNKHLILNNICIACKKTEKELKKLNKEK